MAYLFQIVHFVPCNVALQYYTEVKSAGELSRREHLEILDFYENFYQQSLKGTKYLENENASTDEYAYGVNSLHNRLNNENETVITIRDNKNDKLFGFMTGFRVHEFRGQKVCHNRVMCSDNLPTPGHCMLLATAAREFSDTKIYGYNCANSQQDFIAKFELLGMTIERDHENFPDDLAEIYDEHSPDNREDFVCVWYPE